MCLFLYGLTLLCILLKLLKTASHNVLIESLQEGEQYAKENGLFFLETSAKTAQNVNELFYEIGKIFNFITHLSKLKAAHTNTINMHLNSPIKNTNVLMFMLAKYRSKQNIFCLVLNGNCYYHSYVLRLKHKSIYMHILLW